MSTATLAAPGRPPVTSATRRARGFARLRASMHRAVGSVVLGASLLGLGLTGARVAHAASWPAHALSLIVPFPAGSSPDLLARAVSAPLSDALGEPIVILNRPGAGGNIGTRDVARAKPDGYTLLYTINGPLVTAPALYRHSLGYNPLTDLAPVSLIATSPNVLVTPASLPASTLAQFVALAKHSEAKMNYGSVGPGSAAQLAMEMFKQQAGINLLQIPYNGFPDVLTGMLGGDIQAAFMVPGIAMPQVRAGKLRALAITSLQPEADLPNIPTMAAQGYPDFEAISWNAMLAPAGTPPEIIARLNTLLRQALATPRVREQFATQYFTPQASSPEGLTALIRKEQTRWDAVIDRLHLTLE